ncbi:hypothetical protein [Bartonella sp. CL100XZDX]|uniref:hypothetical protein n=1 Tax=Bartonella sp. CL100XZDX TaxID=3243515 RepID=UPI0035CF618C
MDFGLALQAPAGGERPRIGIPGVKNTDLTQLFAFSAKAPGHSKISRNPGIPAKRDKFMCQVFGFLIPIDRCVDDQNYTLSDKVISEDWQEQSRIFYSIMP